MGAGLALTAYALDAALRQRSREPSEALTRARKAASEKGSGPGSKQAVKDAKRELAKVSMDPNALRLLVYMSLRALDTDKQPRYTGSRETSAFGLGRNVPEPVLPDDERFAAIQRERNAAFQVAKIAIANLVAVGAIKQLQRGREGTRATFALVHPKRLEGLLLGTSDVPLLSTSNVPIA